MRANRFHGIYIRELEVLRVADVTPGMRRVTLGGEQLRAHTAANGCEVRAFDSPGFDDDCKIFFRHPDLDGPLVPVQGERMITWPADKSRVIARTYTVRRWDPEAGEAGEVDFDFVVHGVGPATSWAATTRPGDRVWVAGPKMSSTLPAGADWLLVGADETALPAVGRLLEEWPAGTAGQVFVEVGEEAHRQELPVPDGVTLTWLSRDGAGPGSTTLLSDAIIGAPWWDGKVYAWAMGEALSLAPVRRWLRRDKGLDRQQVEVGGYWRYQDVPVSADDPTLPDFEAAEENDLHERFHRLASLTSGFALRVAATIGLADALADGSGNTAELAAATGAAPASLARLLRYLVEVDVLTADDGRYALTGLGHLLTEEYVLDELSLDGIEARTELGGLLSLLAAVRTGRGDHERWFGAPYEEMVQADADLVAQRVESEDEEASYDTSMIVEDRPFAGMSEVVIAGAGAARYAADFVAAEPDLAITVLASPAELGVMQGLRDGSERIGWQAGSLFDARPRPVDAMLLVDVLERHPDDDAVRVLRQSAAGLRPGGRVFVLTYLSDEQADEHDLAHDLVDLALSGGGERDAERMEALFARAGLAVDNQHTVAWGATLYRLAPAV